MVICMASGNACAWPGLRYGARLFELRNDEGLNIETVQLSGEDRFAYRWIREEQGVLL